MIEQTTTVRYDGFTAEELATALTVPLVDLQAEVASTMDVAHALAAQGATAGTLVLAESQTAGRGRQGRSWTSERSRGIWLTLVERPDDPAAVEVLSLRLAVDLARVLDRFVAEPVSLKWPNDLYTGQRKLAGILIEARWREGRLDWLAAGLGLNVRRPESVPDAGWLRDGVSRPEVLARIIPVLRAATRRRGPLSEAELTEFARRDLARGRRCREPLEGWVAGLDASGALLIDTGTSVERIRAGPLVLMEEP
jgi:BirA family transcriptional regulator, biotin operon repressor / biotin---[acetyl-CoA-carboxylase] ligase